MKYTYPFYKEENEDRQVGLLIPFLGGVLLGGLIAPSFNKPIYNPYPQYPQMPNNYYNNYQMYPYQNYPYNKYY